MSCIPDSVLRCTAPDELTYLPLSDIALFVEDGTTEIPDGYGAYLVSENEIDRYAGLYNAFITPEGCEPGSFVYIDATSEVHLLGTADLPDRTLFTTGMCNSNCIMCPYTEKFRLSAAHEQIDMLFRFVDLMNPNAEYLCITGGEPTLLKGDFIRLLDKVKTHFKDTMVHILTNGRTFYYDDFLDAYKKARPYKTLLGIPLHASYYGLHDQITQSQGSFVQTIKGIDNLYMAGEHIELRIVTSGLNYVDLPDLAKFITERYPQIHHVCFMGLEMMGNSMINRAQVWCSYNIIWPYIRDAIDVLISHGIPVKLYNYPLCMVDKKYHPLYKKSITPSKIEYLNACSDCFRKNECGGFFRTTKIMPDIQVNPYTR